MTPSILILASAIIVGLLGTAHLLLTFRGPKLLPQDATLVESMKSGYLRITRQTTIWRAWIGFNASHSLGAMLFGLVYGYLALEHPAFLFESVFLQVLGLLVLGSYLVLARTYWFITPIAGISLALASYVAGLGWAQF
jgi:hypothetical protein